MRLPEQEMEAPLPLLGVRGKWRNLPNSAASHKVATMFFGWKLTTFCVLILCDVARISAGNSRQLPNSTIKPGFPIPIKTNDPGVQSAARFGVYTYNNKSNDIFLFKESNINKAMLQVVRGLKYELDVDIGRTICSKRTHANLDRCDFQRNETLKQLYVCERGRWNNYSVPLEISGEQIRHSDAILKCGLSPGCRKFEYQFPCVSDFSPMKATGSIGNCLWNCLPKETCLAPTSMLFQS
ncbi:hypothetical protein lerEdw1_009170 [Lerista edwardsae]|nr:hypothetical protein lerEdw1_009170 [Lerista edwardsae]